MIILIMFLQEIISGCAEYTARYVYPVTTGFHASGEQFGYVLRNQSGHETPTQPGTYVI